MLVIDPALHTAHGVVDWALYCPDVHIEQVVAPSDPRVSVTEPASHSEQADWPASPWKRPTTHSAHADVDDALY